MRMLAPECQAQIAGRHRIEHTNVDLRIGRHASAIEVGRADGPEGIIHNRNFGVRVHRPVENATVKVLIRLAIAEGEDGNAGGVTRLSGALAQPFYAAIGKAPPAIGMVGKRERELDATSERAAHCIEQLLDIRTLAAPGERIQPAEDLDRKILILEVHIPSSLRQRIDVELLDGCNAVWGKRVGVWWDRAHDLSGNTAGCEGGSTDGQLAGPVSSDVPARNLGPTLRDIALNVANHGAAQAYMHIVPGMCRGPALSDTIR